MIKTWSGHCTLTETHLKPNENCFSSLSGCKVQKAQKYRTTASELWFSELETSKGSIHVRFLSQILFVVFVPGGTAEELNITGSDYRPVLVPTQGPADSCVCASVWGVNTCICCLKVTELTLNTNNHREKKNMWLRHLYLFVLIWWSKDARQQNDLKPLKGEKRQRHKKMKNEWKVCWSLL